MRTREMTRLLLATLTYIYASLWRVTYSNLLCTPHALLIDDGVRIFDYAQPRGNIAVN